MTAANDDQAKPMAITVGNEFVLYKGDALIVGVFHEKELSPAGRSLDDTLGGVLTSVLESGDIDGSKDQLALVYVHGRIPAPRVLLIGLGPRDEVTAEGLRRASGNALRHLRGLGLGSAGSVLHSGVPGTGESVGQALAEGALLGLYEFCEYRSPDPKRPPKRLASMSLLDADPGRREELKRGTAIGEAIARATIIARDLSNEPPNRLPPAVLADRVSALAQSAGVACTVLGPEQLREQGFNTILAVGQGSANPPALIVLEHNANLDEAPLVYVGKGICFDSGGLSLKTAGGMVEMKHDMSGAAAVIGAVLAAAELGIARRVVGIVAAAENMPSGTAQRPGDVVRAYGGTTIEVLNTDAEGRLVLADALAYAVSLNPKAVVDVATLTGAVVTALGHQACGMLGREDDSSAALMDRVRAAAAATHERVWQLPLWDDYDEDVKSDVADIKNVGSGAAGTIAGAAFLKRFVGNHAWAHLDIAGVFASDKTTGYSVKGASGFGTRLLTQLARDWTD
ncbi:leucyl aminopeptidase [Candidatus Poribacteria bacterium]|nr:leucyl aminopeptidase [Candidatus Poribacteria bacterium]